MKDLGTRGWRRISRERLPAEREGRVSDPRLRFARIRLFIAMGVFGIVFSALAARTFHAAAVAPDESAGRIGVGSEYASRADIVDRNGVLLASDLPAQSLYMDPQSLQEPEDAYAALATVLPGIDRESFFRKAASDSRFEWVRRNLSPNQVYAVNRLGIPGLGFKDGLRRIYPKGRLFAHVLGFANVDGKGVAGLEKAADAEIGRRAAEGGEPLMLSIDTRVQYALADALEGAMTAHRAVGAAGIVMDVENGEVLALASLPAFDPKAPEADGKDARFNRATLGTYELGSTFKAFTAAMALESGAADLGDSYDATKPLRVSRFRIRDSHPENRWLTVPEILIHSSNIGAARMAVDAGTEVQKSFMKAIGMFEPVQLELPERGRPIVPGRWTELTTMTVGFGHGIAVTPLHLATGFATLVNGGFKVKPTLLHRRTSQPAETVRIMSGDTSTTLRKLLYLVVDQGTGSKAAAPGYLVGGKTGTAEKAVDGRYLRKTLISSFVGVFPIERPRYLVLALLDEPKGIKETFGYATAGWTAAPVVGKVVARIGPMLGVHPSIPSERGEEPGKPLHIAFGGGGHAAF